MLSFFQAPNYHSVRVLWPLAPDHYSQKGVRKALISQLISIAGPGGSDVLLRTATSLQGPWTPDVKVFTATPMDDGLTYAGVAHPYLDPSGQTLTISYTNNNHIEVFKLSFLK